MHSEVEANHVGGGVGDGSGRRKKRPWTLSSRWERKFTEIGFHSPAKRTTDRARARSPGMSEGKSKETKSSEKLSGRGEEQQAKREAPSAIEIHTGERGRADISHQIEKGKRSRPGTFSTYGMNRQNKRENFEGRRTLTGAGEESENVLEREKRESGGNRTSPPGGGSAPKVSRFHALPKNQGTKRSLRKKEDQKRKTQKYEGN